MKRFMCIGLVCVLVLSLTACGKVESGVSVPESVSVLEAPVSAAESVSDLEASGLDVVWGSNVDSSVESEMPEELAEAGLYSPVFDSDVEWTEENLYLYNWFTDGDEIDVQTVLADLSILETVSVMSDTLPGDMGSMKDGTLDDLDQVTDEKLLGSWMVGDGSVLTFTEDGDMVVEYPDKTDETSTERYTILMDNLMAVGTYTYEEATDGDGFVRRDVVMHMAYYVDDDVLVIRQVIDSGASTGELDYMTVCHRAE